MLNRILQEFKVMYAFVERQFYLYKRYWRWEFVFLLYTLANTLAIGFLGSGVQAVTGAQLNQSQLITYLLIGSLLWGYLSGLFWEVSSVVSWERWEGTIEYTFMAPISRISHLVGICSFAIIYGILRTALVLGVVVLFFKLDLSQANLFGAFLTLAAASFSFIGFGMMVAILPLLSPEKGHTIAHIVEAVLLMVSGVYYPIKVLPGWMQVLAKFSPATYTLSGMRAALVQGASTYQLGGEMLLLLLMGACLIPIGLILFQLAEIHAKHAGKLSRAG